MKGSPINKAVLSFIRHARQSRGLSGAEAARRAGIPRGSYGCLEMGNYRINLECLFRILAALGADIKEVWPWEFSRPADQVTERLVEQASQARPHRVSVGDLVGAVCQACALDEADLASAKRGGRISEARQAAAYILANDFKHLKMNRLARRFKVHPSSLSKALERLETQLHSGALLKRRIEMVREALAKLKPPPKAVEGRFRFEDAQAARAFADFLNSELSGVLAETEGVAAHHLNAIKVTRRKGTVRVASTDELSGIFELCWLSFAAAWSRKGADSPQPIPLAAPAHAVRQLVRRAGRGCCAISRNGEKAAPRKGGEGA